MAAQPQRSKGDRGRRKTCRDQHRDVAETRGAGRFGRDNGRDSAARPTEWRGHGRARTATRKAPLPGSTLPCSTN